MLKKVKVAYSLHRDKYYVCLYNLILEEGGGGREARERQRWLDRRRVVSVRTATRGLG
jgi:hypothetical protein